MPEFQGVWCQRGVRTLRSLTVTLAGLGGAVAVLALELVQRANPLGAVVFVRAVGAVPFAVTPDTRRENRLTSR